MSRVPSQLRGSSLAGMRLVRQREEGHVLVVVVRGDVGLQLGDGGAAYTIQALWTQARENLDVTTVIFANNSYNILNVEYGRLGVTDVGEIAASLFDIGNPSIDWVALAKGGGVDGGKANTAEELCTL